MQSRSKISKMIAANVVGTGRPVRELPESVRRITGNIVVALSDGDFISFAARPPAGDKALVAIKDRHLYPLTLPNVARNVIAHEKPEEGHGTVTVHTRGAAGGGANGVTRLRPFGMRHGPGLSQPFRAFLRRCGRKDVDARDERGHDGSGDQVRINR